MKKYFFIFFTGIVTSLFFQSCEIIQDLGTGNITVFTVPADSITSISAISGGVVRTGGESSFIKRGVCWSTEREPSVNLSTKTSDSTETISFSTRLDKLLPNTEYYVRAYAENIQGVYYGNEISFKTTQPTIPLVITAKPANIKSSTVICGGSVINDGGSPVKSRGVCWSTTENPVLYPGQMTTDSTGSGVYISQLTGLAANKRYYIRAYAVNNVGTAYGDQQSFVTTTAQLAILNTGSPTEITRSSAIVAGTITDDGGSPVTVRGICWGEMPDPTADKSNRMINGAGTGKFSGLITGLFAGKTYYARAYAINSPGIAYGNTVTFSTEQAGLPSVTTNLPTNISYSSALCSGMVSDEGGAPLTATGFCWSTTENPTIELTTKIVIGSVTGSFGGLISGLNSNTYYFVRAYVTGSGGTVYGNQIIFKTLMTTPPQVSTGSVTEIALTGARAAGSISSDGGEEIIERGFCWSTIKNVSVDQGVKMICGTGTGNFSCTLSWLNPGTTYYLKAYARNRAGMSYGTEVSFTTTAGQIKQVIGMSYLPLSNTGPGLLHDYSGWHYYAFTKGADRTGKIYIDGELAAEGVFNNVGYFYSSLFIGAGFSTEWTGFFRGWLDELRISDIVRSPEEIRESYNSNKQLDCDANTFGLFHFNESEGKEIISSTGITGTLYNGVKFAEGRFSNGLYFDGIDDKGDCNIDIPEKNITIEFWAKPEGIQESTIIQPYGFNNSNIYFKVVSGN